MQTKKLSLFKYFDKTPQQLELLLDTETIDIQRAEVCCVLGYFEYFKSNFIKAAEYYNIAHKIYIEHNDDIKIACCLAHLALFNYYSDNTRLIRTHTLLNDALYIVQGYDSPEADDVKALILLYNGMIDYNEKNFSQALNYYKKALTMTVADSLVYARVLDNLGIFYLRSSNFHIAIKYLEDAIEVKQKYNLDLEIATTRLLIGRYYISIENYEKALVELKSSIQIVKVYDDNLTYLRIIDEITKINITIGDLEAADNYLHQALEKCANCKDKPVCGYLNATMVSLLIKKGKIDEAISHLKNEVIPVFDRGSSIRGHALVKQLKADIFVITGRYEEALANLHEALEMYRNIKLYFEEAKCYFELAKVYKKINNPQMVVASLLEALNITSENEFPILNKKIEDFLYEIDAQEWANIVNKTARKEKVFSESKALLDTLDLLEILNDQSKQTKDPLLALLRLGRSISAQTNIDRLIEVIAQETKLALNADRCTVFLYDKENNQLWSKVALGMDSKEIRFPANAGLAGHVISTGETVNIQDAYNDERFNKDIDKQTGYKTQNILCMPIRNLDHKIIGVFQILNKQGGKYFTNEDEDLLVAIGSNASIALENANLFTKQQQMILEQQKTFTSFINTLATSLDARDRITAGHSIRVTQYTSIIAKEMKLDDDKIDTLEKAALLHDIGKIGVQDNVLFKEGRLTDDEYRHIQKHAEITSDILRQMYFTEALKDVPEIASSHHERYDGKGYFRGRSGEKIHLGGRILAVGDVFDAITSKRHYRDRMDFVNVLNILQEGSGSHFDPKVIDTFFNITTDKILSVLISAYEKELDINMAAYFAQYKINDLYKYLKKFPEDRNEEEIKLIGLFNKYYVND
ncbi:MAG: tetratricopeptide repeat protein [Candidatus Gastranaerophilales bacterium]|nr:tetratricopeptide repeat protein [Candidatus Gastranaerophilales bacterium]